MGIENPLVWHEYRPAKEPYLGARLLEGLPGIFGDRGNFVVGLFAYLRWVDNTVDERIDLTRDQKLDFLKRQMEMAAGFVPDNPLPMETVFCKLPWDCVPENKLRQKTITILASIVDDVDHQGFKPRSDREVRHYNWRTILPVIDGLFLAINGRSMKESRSMMKLLDAYMRIGSLEDLGDDLEQGVIKLPTKAKDCQTPAKVLAKCDRDWFSKQKWNNLKTIADNAGAFLKLDIPDWQKLACVLYTGEVLLKKTLLVSRERAVRNLGG